MKAAIKIIEKHGVLLVFPINNKKEPMSLWAAMHPRTKMRWEWDDDADSKVFDMWRLMKKLSDCRKVVYSKWYQGRATFFSRDLFAAILRLVLARADEDAIKHKLSFTARELLDLLEMDSPQSTKELKKAADLRGKENEATYQRGMKELFSKFLVIAFGEVDDGAFPSLGVGATKTLYEDLWLAAQELSVAEAQKILDKFMPLGSAFRKQFEKALTSL
jgi:hypothetical protein